MIRRGGEEHRAIVRGLRVTGHCSVFFGRDTMVCEGERGIVSAFGMSAGLMELYICTFPGTYRTHEVSHVQHARLQFNF